MGEVVGWGGEGVEGGQGAVRGWDGEGVTGEGGGQGR